MKPLRPVHCPICGNELGFVYRDGLSLRAEVRECSERCRTMWSFAKGRAYQTPIEVRSLHIATSILERELK